VRKHALVGLLVAACGATAPPPAAPSPRPRPRAEIRVSSSTCPDPPAAEARLRAVLVEHDAVHADLIVEVSAQPGELQLVVLRTGGDVGLDRRYPIGPADCDSAAELLALGVDRFLSSFPEWAGPAPPPETPPPPPETPPRRGLGVALTAATHALVDPLGADVQVGALLTRRGLGGTAMIRATLPQAAGDGHFQQTSFLGGVAWRQPLDGWELRVELRAGGLLVSGLGFDDDRASWLPWWEAAVTGSRRFGWGTAGLELAGTALRHRAVTSDRSVSEAIPWLRIGVAGTLDVFP
jgi:hypothetical protein